jgi:UDP-glucose:glycoprotein glucosyltransferase
MYPGQLPSVRRDIHNAIVPIDFTHAPDVSSVVDTIMSLVKRGIPLRWGLVPQTLTEGASEQARVVYYLQDAYGLSAVINYLRAVGELCNALASLLTQASSHLIA